MKQPFLVTAMVAAGCLLASEKARATDWIDRSLTLPVGTLAINGGLGFAQSTNVGLGANLDAALGLPLGFEAGLRFGFPFGNDGLAARADAFGRLYDPISLSEASVGAGASSGFANPELRLQKSLVDVGVAAIAFDLRATLPTSSGSDMVVAPGLRIRLKLPRIMRLDASAYLPLGFTSPGPTYALDVPVNLWFQAGGLFVGPETGVFYTHFPGTTISVPDVGPTTIASSSNTDVHLGAGVGYTFGGMFDVKGEVLTTRINDSNWSKYIGGGVGIGVHLGLFGG